MIDLMICIAIGLIWGRKAFGWALLVVAFIWLVTCSAMLNSVAETRFLV